MAMGWYPCLLLPKISILFLQNNILEEKHLHEGTFVRKILIPFLYLPSQSLLILKNVMLEVNNLNKSYENFSLKDVTFTINNDCITGFIGTNGSGKTTTIKVIPGLILKYSGKIYD